MNTVSKTITDEMKRNLEIALKSVNDEFIEQGISLIVRRWFSWKGYCENTPLAQRELDKQFMICGGKSNFLYFQRANLDMVREREKKSLVNSIDKRDYKIIKKLTDNGIYSVSRFHAEGYTDDGYQGVFSVDGYNIFIDVVYAGGYNIQRAHHRTLVTIIDDKGNKL